MTLTFSALDRVVERFERNFLDCAELGASVCIWWNGVEVLSLGQGWCEREKVRPWTEKTLVPVYSATKGPAAAALLLALHHHGLGPQTAVRHVWPAFPIPEATFAQLLSHQCGLAALDLRASIWNHQEVVAAIEVQSPAWPLGEGHGYHPRIFGALVDEPVRRLTGQTLGAFFQREIAGPLALDFWIGLPEALHHRVATLYPGKADKSDLEQGFYQEFHHEGSLTRRAFFSPRGLHSVQEMNTPAAWSAGFPAMGGLGSASALAQFYQAAIGLVESPLPVHVRDALASLQSQSADRVLLRETAFTCGCQMDPLDASGNKKRRLYGPSVTAFGHPGAGGSHGFADPASGLSFAYVMNQMELSVFPSIKCTAMIDALFAE
jgi:CubicO group peptidase (beta-lactamase class C family)